jgi:hypothetical protein
MGKINISVIIIGIIFLFAQWSSALDAPAGVLELKEGGYVFADYPEVFDGFGDGFTIELWFYLTDYPKDPNEQWILIDKPQSYLIRVVGKRPQLPPDPPEIICGLEYGIYYDKNSIGVSYITLAKDRINNWVHFAFMMRGTRPTVSETDFLDGKNLGLGVSSLPPSFVGGFAASSDPLFIGGREGRTSIKGWIDEVRISKGWRYTPFQDFEPQQRFETDQQTIALWHFDEGPEAHSYKDSSGNGYTLYAGGTFSVNIKGKSTTTWGMIKRY